MNISNADKCIHIHVYLFDFWFFFHMQKAEENVQFKIDSFYVHFIPFFAPYSTFFWWKQQLALSPRLKEREKLVNHFDCVRVSSLFDGQTLGTREKRKIERVKKRKKIDRRRQKKRINTVKEKETDWNGERKKREKRENVFLFTLWITVWQRLFIAIYFDRNHYLCKISNHSLIYAIQTHKL